MMSINSIPQLKGEYLSDFVERATLPTAMIFSNRFETNDAPFTTIEWEVQFKSGSMTPFTSRGSRAPSIGMDGISKRSAKAAYMSQSAVVGEEILNELRLAGTRQDKAPVSRTLDTLQNQLVSNMQKRREWMFSQMIFEGGFDYTAQSDNKAVEFAEIDYQIPATHKVTLAENHNWNGGADADPIGDIFDMGQRLEDSLGTREGVELYMRSSTLEKLFKADKFLELFNTQILSKAQIIANRLPLMAELFGVGKIVPYNNQFEVYADLAAPYVSGTIVRVIDASPFEVGGRLFLRDGKTSAYDFREITAVDVATGEITVASAFATTAKIGQKAGMRKFFLKDTKIVGFVPTVEGKDVAEALRAPYGLDGGNLAGTYGVKMNTEIERNPDTITQVITNLELPVLKFAECVYMLENVIA